MKKIFFMFALATLLVGASAGVFLGYLWYQFTSTQPSSEKVEVIYEVEQGRSFAVIARDLEQKNLVKSALAFQIYARILGETSKMKVGEYALATNMTPRQVLDVISSGKSIQKSFTIAEGLNIFEIAQLYESQGFGKSAEFLALCKNKELTKDLLGDGPKNLEGFLFPETYKLTKYTTAKMLITQMVKRFLYVFEEISKKSPPSKLNRLELVTLASIIEKETGAPEERPMISSVFYNRLEKGIKLQTDPTVIYAKSLESGKHEINISKADLTNAHPYNTYSINGLPPGPIANPGKEAILAAFAPAQTEFLFFVSQNNGTHIFTTEYKDHEKAVVKFQVDKKAREGKSWRDLKKRK